MYVDVGLFTLQPLKVADATFFSNSNGKQVLFHFL